MGDMGGLLGDARNPASTLRRAGRGARQERRGGRGVEGRVSILCGDNEGEIDRQLKSWRLVVVLVDVVCSSRQNSRSRKLVYEIIMGQFRVSKWARH